MSCRRRRCICGWRRFVSVDQLPLVIVLRVHQHPHRLTRQVHWEAFHLRGTPEQLPTLQIVTTEEASVVEDTIVATEKASVDENTLYLSGAISSGNLLQMGTKQVISIDYHIVSWWVLLNFRNNWHDRLYYKHFTTLLSGDYKVIKEMNLFPFFSQTKSDLIFRVSYSIFEGKTLIR